MGKFAVRGSVKGRGCVAQITNSYNTKIVYSVAYILLYDSLVGDGGGPCNTNAICLGCRAPYFRLEIRPAALSEAVRLMFNRRKCSDFFRFMLLLLRPMAMQGKIRQYSIPPYVEPLLTACSAEDVTLRSRYITTPSSPRANQPTLISSRRAGDPVYSRTVIVLEAFSSAFFSGHSHICRDVVMTAIVIYSCPRHAA